MTRREEKKKYYRNNKKKILKQKKIYYIKNKQKILEQVKKYYKNNKEKKREYQQKNREKINIKIYQQKNRKHIRELARKNYHKNIQQRRERRREYIAILHNKIANNLRARTRLALKGSYKNLSTLQLLGCSVNKFKIHLEKQFKSSMTWNNWSRKGWHIDHIKSCCSFDLSKPKEQKKCFHYTNLQPLWAGENLSKGKK